MFKKFDGDGNGKIEFKEFIELYRKVIKEKSSSAAAPLLFQCRSLSQS
jgi:Ca2+-binding EF-hand superfamily protein